MHIISIAILFVICLQVLALFPKFCSFAILCIDLSFLLCITAFYSGLLRYDQQNGTVNNVTYHSIPVQEIAPVHESRKIRRVDTQAPVIIDTINQYHALTALGNMLEIYNGHEHKDCVTDRSGSPPIGLLYYLGVRVRGTPFINTPFRWGYGWKFGRGYKIMTTEENIVADNKWNNFCNYSALFKIYCLL